MQNSIVYMENNQLPTYAKHFMLLKVFYCAKLNNKQNGKVIYRLDRLRTVHSNR